MCFLFIRNRKRKVPTSHTNSEKNNNLEFSKTSTSKNKTGNGDDTMQTVSTSDSPSLELAIESHLYYPEYMHAKQNSNSSNKPEKGQNATEHEWNPNEMTDEEFKEMLDRLNDEMLLEYLYTEQEQEEELEM